MNQTTFGQRVNVYEVKKRGRYHVAVRAKSNTSLGKLSIFFEMSSSAVSPRVGEDILVIITTPADSAPAAREASIAWGGFQPSPEA